MIKPKDSDYGWLTRGVGQVVHFIEDGKGNDLPIELHDRVQHIGKHRAAMIVEHVSGKPAALVVFVPEGIFVREDIEEDTFAKEPGTWHRIEQ